MGDKSRVTYPGIRPLYQLHEHFSDLECFKVSLRTSPGMDPTCTQARASLAVKLHLDRLEETLFHHKQLNVISLASDSRDATWRMGLKASPVFYIQGEGEAPISMRSMAGSPLD